MKTFIITLIALATTGNAASINARVKGGEEAADGQFPYQVSIRVNDNHVCGGSIMNKRWILTAAHCIARKPPAYLTVLAGTNNVKDIENGELYKVTIVTTHQRFDSRTYHNDIGLVRVDRDIIFNDKIQPIELHTAMHIDDDTELTLSGWGSTKNPDKLQYVKIHSFNLSKCQMLHTLVNVVYNTEMCTYTHGKSACVGDYGGPLVLDGQLVGVVAWGLECGRGYPDVHTKVIFYVDWINERIHEIN